MPLALVNRSFAEIDYKNSTNRSYMNCITVVTDCF